MLRICWSPDGKRIAIGAMFQPIVIWNIDSGKSFRTFSDKPLILNCVKWSPNGRLLATAELPGPNLWDVESGKSIRQLIEDINSRH